MNDSGSQKIFWSPIEPFAAVLLLVLGSWLMYANWEDMRTFLLDADAFLFDIGELMVIASVVLFIRVFRGQLGSARANAKKGAENG